MVLQKPNNPGEYIDDWSTFRIPTHDMAVAFAKHAEWLGRYELLCGMQQEGYFDDRIAEMIDEAYYMRRKWEERSNRYLNENGGFLSMASGVHRNFREYYD